MKAQYLKKILLALSILFLFSYSNHVFAQPNIKIQINILKKISSKDLRRQGGKFYAISIDMINCTDTAIHFWIMNIFDESLISNNDKIKPYQPENIDRIYAKLQQIDTGQKLTFMGVIQVVGPLKAIKNKYYKFGFIFINEAEVKEDRDFPNILLNKTNEGKDIIWSEPFKIL